MPCWDFFVLCLDLGVILWCPVTVSGSVLGVTLSGALGTICGAGVKLGSVDGRQAP